MKPYTKDITGKKFGRLTAIEYVGKNSCRHSLWLCECECGNKHVTSLDCLTQGNTRSCGCLNDEARRKGGNRRTHGMCDTPIYRTWKSIKRRCYNPNTQDYKHWGARGITVHPTWKDDFKEFYNHVSALPHFGEKGYSLDRIDVNGNYEPGNVRWATAKQQANNKRKVRDESENALTVTDQSLTWEKAAGTPGASE